MGIEKDYLMRQLFMLFEVFQKILRFRKKGENQKANDEIKYFYECLKIDDNLELLGIEEMIELLENKMNLNNEQLEVIAFVLKEQGELNNNENVKIDLFRKSFFLLDKIERESSVYSMNRQMNLNELKNIIMN